MIRRESSKPVGVSVTVMIIYSNTNYIYGSMIRNNYGSDFVCGGQIVGEHGGTPFPFRFWRGNAVPL